MRYRTTVRAILQIVKRVSIPLNHPTYNVWKFTIIRPCSINVVQLVWMYITPGGLRVNSESFSEQIQSHPFVRSGIFMFNLQVLIFEKLWRNSVRVRWRYLAHREPHKKKFKSKPDHCLFKMLFSKSRYVKKILNSQISRQKSLSNTFTQY